MFNNNSVSISISDDESDELGRMRARVRRKRRKPAHHINKELPRRVIRFFVKYWTVLIFLPAAGLLVFEATRIGRKPSPEVNPGLSEVRKPSLVENSELSAMQKPSLGKKTEGNLNRLDPVTRVVGGVRERCLKLLPPEELNHLDIPVTEESSSPEWIW